jgi:replicative DNA helicase
MQDAHPSDLEQTHPRRGGGPRFRVLRPGEDTGERPLPHSLEAEEHLLSTLMLDGRDVMGKCQAARLQPSWFYDTRHGTIYEALQELYRQGHALEAATVAEHLRERGRLEQVGGYPMIAQVSSRVPTSAQADFFLAKVRDLAAMRAVIRQSRELAEHALGNTGGGEQLAGQLEQHQAWVARTLDMLRADSATMQEAAAAAYQRTLDKLAGRPDKSRWIFTGLKEFDERFGPFDSNNEDWLVVVGAFQGGAKSSFMRAILLHNLRAGKSAQVFLLETGLGKLLELMACTAAGVNSQTLDQLPRDMHAKFEQCLAEMHGYVGKTLHVSDEVIPVETLTARIDDHARRHGAPDVIAIDHIHLLRSIKGFKAREPEMGYIAKELARCGKRHNRTVLGLAQLNRSARSDGGNRRPQSHDIRDSGEIEQAARRILLLHKPDKDMRGSEQTDNQSQIMLEIIQAKHNNGRVGHREFWFRRDLTRFFDIGDGELNSMRAVAPPPPTSSAKPGGSKAAFRRGGAA